jgi:hypothetical protein
MDRSTLLFYSMNFMHVYSRHNSVESSFRFSRKMGTQVPKCFRQNRKTIKELLGMFQIIFFTGSLIASGMKHDHAQSVGQLIVKFGNFLVRGKCQH